MSFNFDLLDRHLTFRQRFQQIYAYEPEGAAPIYLDELFDDVLRSIETELITASIEPSNKVGIILNSAEDILSHFITFMRESCDPELSDLIPVLEEKIRNSTLDFGL